VSRASLSMVDAEKVCKHVFEKLSPGQEYESLPAETRASAALGALLIVETLQDMGYRIAAPLVLAHKGTGHG